MYTSYNMYFRHRLAVIALHDIQHLFLAELPALIPVGIQAGIGAELAGEHTKICGVHIEIKVEIGLVPLQFLADVVRQGAQIGERSLLKKLQPFGRRDPFSCQYLFPDPVQFLVRCPYDRLYLGLCAHSLSFYSEGKVMDCSGSCVPIFKASFPCQSCFLWPDRPADLHKNSLSSLIKPKITPGT